MAESPPARADGPPPRPASATAPALARGQLHEIHAATCDWPAALAFALAAGADEPAAAIVLVRPRGDRNRPVAQIHGEGLLGLGIDPARLLIVEARDDTALLRAAHDAARCPGLALVVIESWGRFAGYDLTASRRLVLAAAQSRVPIVLLRGEAVPRPSAAHSRWAIRAAPSVALTAEAPGHATVEAELLRRRGGPAGMTWRLEWERDNGGFAAADPWRQDDGSPGPDGAGAALSGAVVPLVPLRARAA